MMRTNGYSDRLYEITNALMESGIEPVNPEGLLGKLSDGLMIRFPTKSKPRKANGWLVAYFDRGLPFVVLAGDWATGAEMKWTPALSTPPCPEERVRLAHRLAEAKKARETEQAFQWHQAALRAETIWNNAEAAAPDHPYLLRKGIEPHLARMKGKDLILPITDFNGRIWSLQSITPEGDKRLMAGGKKTGYFIAVNQPATQARVLICEGWATGCTLAEQDPGALVLSAIDCGNLKAVALSARNRWPDADLIVCGDDDRKTMGNPGANAAKTAAFAARARFSLPAWPATAPLELSDFNDLHNWLKEQQ